MSDIKNYKKIQKTYKDRALQTVEYKGRIYQTTIKKDLTDEEFKQAAIDYFKKPNIEDVEKELKSIGNGKTKVAAITKYYFRDLMALVKINRNNWCIQDVFDYKPLMEFFAGKCDINDKVFPQTNCFAKNLDTAFRLCGASVASKPAQFPMKTIDMLLDTYCPKNGNYYDYSCGWGVRMLSALKHDINYYGTDPNYILVDRLHELHNKYDETNSTKSNVDIHCTGAEIYIPEFNNKMDFIFSSPPYFDKEDYKIGKQSYIEGMSYQEWLNTFIQDLVNNSYKYLKADGYFGINIKNYPDKGQNMLDDICEIITNSGFELVAIEDVINKVRCLGSSAWEKHTNKKIDTSEKACIFRKTNIM